MIPKLVYDNAWTSLENWIIPTWYYDFDYMVIFVVPEEVVTPYFTCVHVEK